MGPFLSSITVIGGPLPWVVYGLAVLSAVWLVLRGVRSTRRLRTLLVLVGSALAGALLGLALCWVVGDLANAFDVTLSVVARSWVAAAFAGVGLALASLPHARAAARVGMLASVVIFALLGTLGVNADFGQYPTLASVFGVSSFPDLPAQVLSAQKAAAAAASTDSAAPLWQTWHEPADAPAAGLVGAVTIPATVSHFAAREALVYLPPAALVANPPALPVLIMMSGQPGSPDHVFIAGHLDSVIDKIAAENNGLAPIVVVADQLSAPEVNPMCVDSAIGNSATYMTVDVPAWIRAHLNVQATTSAWAIGGFSQGGTCAIQLGAAHPDLFGSILDVSGELEPKDGSQQTTIRTGFDGDEAAYEAAKPLNVIARNAPYTDMVAVFAAGALDTKYTPWVATIASAAQDAGMKTTLLSSPGTAHDWYTVRYAFTHGLAAIYAHMGLTAASG